ncbi:MAG: DNA translocase FtsK 4TM domain-containing protein, partial [Rhodobacteraceae bacterium]|nr:DNA translocase FtsK 4TM domain-containing protein [Paracoccaceae bacterium]
MASYQARQRDPLLDQNLQAAIERRGKELLGVALIVLAGLTGLMLASYSPDDPSWLTASDAPVHNYLGHFGASIASPLFVIAGLASWGIAVLLAAWGARFVTHVGEERALGRVIFAPIAIAVAAVYASTHVASAAWDHSFGLGGLFGDTVLGAALGIVPVGASLGLKLISLIMALTACSAALFVLGFDRNELKSVARFLIVGTIFAYDALMRLLDRGARASLDGAQALRDRRRERAEATTAPRGAEHRAEPPVEMPPEPRRRASILRADQRHDDDLLEQAHPREKRGILARFGEMARRGALGADAANAIESELVERMPRDGWDDATPSEERIRARIADAVRARGVSGPAARVEPPLTAAQGGVGTALRAATETTAALARTAPSEGPELGLTAEPLFETDDDLDRNAFLGLDQDDAQLAQSARGLVQHAPRKSPQPSRRARAEAEPLLQFDEPSAAYEMPPLSLLASPSSIQRQPLSDEALAENARMLESVLDDYGVKGEIVSVRPGPVVTMYELEPAPGLKASRVIGLSDDIARSMSALSARVSTVPGRTVIGIELPNAFREKVVLREILSAREYGDSNLRLPLALGKDIAGEPIIANLAKMPHLLIAGTTGSGKSVAINTMILSLLYKLTPEECRLIMIDPKMLELSVYDGIPHLLSPVVTDPKKAVVALKWVVGEMEERYRKMSKMNVRNIEGFNGRVREALAKGEMFKRTVQTGFDEETGDPVFETEEIQPVALPYIVVIVDEMADLMMVAGKEI